MLPNWAPLVLKHEGELGELRETKAPTNRRLRRSQAGTLAGVVSLPGDVPACVLIAPHPSQNEGEPLSEGCLVRSPPLNETKGSL